MRNKKQQKRKRERVDNQPIEVYQVRLSIRKGAAEKMKRPLQKLDRSESCM